jgi:hypothetical protein
MLAATLIAIFIIPVSFYVVERLSRGARETPDEAEAASEPEPPAARAGVS